MQTLFRSFFTVSFYTLLSRILGFIRDIFIAKYLGSTVISDAFFVAFRIPNFFRRVFAEGAYSAALIPVLSGIVINKKNNKDAHDFIESTGSFLFFSTVILTIIFYLGMPFFIQILAPGFTKNIEAYNYAVHFGKIIFPYIIFISLVSHFTSIMNVHGRFAAGSFAPSLLNISLIFSLLVYSSFFSTAGHALSYGVLLGGLLQFILMYGSILKFYRPLLKIPKINQKVKNFFKLFFPAIIGSGVIQLNIVIGTIIASFLPIGAISHIYYADRLNQFPLAIFGIALGVVLLPSLSKSIKKFNFKEINNIQNRSLEFSLLISLPSAIGLFILSFPIINILFQRGEFLPIDTYYTSQTLSIFSVGLPAYILIKVLVTCFFAREDTKTPLYISIISVLINIILSLIFIQTMREMGIALATSISAWVNALLLFLILKRNKDFELDNKIKKNIFKIIISVLFMGLICFLLNENWFVNLDQMAFSLKVSLLLIIIALCNLIYTLLIFMLKVITIHDLKSYIKK